MRHNMRTLLAVLALVASTQASAATVWVAHTSQSFPGDGTLRVCVNAVAWASKNVAGEPERVKRGLDIRACFSTPVSPTALQIRNAMIQALLTEANSSTEDHPAFYVHTIIYADSTWNPTSGPGALGFSQTVANPG
jgi:hypothetical protein